MKRNSSSEAQRDCKRRRDQVHDPQSTMYPAASLLGLAVELRLQILQYLLPDKGRVPIRIDIEGARHHPTSKNIRTYRPKFSWPNLTLDEVLDETRPNDDTRPNDFIEYRALVNRGYGVSAYRREVILQGYIPLRFDLESCSPGVMRVNRQLYQESLPLVYKRNTFAAHIFDEGMSICSHSYSNHDDDRDLSELSLQIGRIELLDLVITYEMLTEEDEFNNTVMLSASLANALAQSTSLRRLLITLEVYPCYSDYDTTSLGGTHEKDLTRLLRCFEQLRNLEYMAIQIQGCRETGLDGTNRKEWSYQLTPRFSKVLRKIPDIVQYSTTPKPKPIDVGLFRRYLKGHQELFPGRQDVVESTSPESGRDLLRDAWEACASSDMTAYEKVLETTKNQWRTMEQARIEEMLDEFDELASVVRP